LGVVAGREQYRWNDAYRQLHNAYAQAGYQLRLINPGDEIPDTIPALLVLGGAFAFDAVTLYQIDRYIQQGGRVLVTTKSVDVNTEGGLEAQLAEGELLSMLSAYGVSILPEITMDRSALTMQYQTRAPSGAMQFRIVRNPQWIRVLGENGNKKHPVSANFSGLDLYWANPLDLHAPNGVEADYLFTSTAEAWTMKEPFSTNPEAAYMFERDAKDTRGTKMLGASLSGTFPSWFADKPKPEVPEGQELADRPAETKPARLIVIGETDFATAFMGVSGGQRNLDFLVQAADWLCNDDDIIGIRSRESGSGRLDTIIDPVKRAAAMQFARIVNIFFIPLLVVIAGILLAIRRNARARASAVECNNVSNASKENSNVQ
jgi:ABC-type uncharacterized transport system involved in gliding motility auxiliary subunit